jgi:low temperature requirement protein LtrA
VELLWDLVFVFAITQVTTLLAAGPSWGRFGHAMLVLALVWWAWSAFVWASNALEAESRRLRGFLLLATILIFIAGLALPHDFGNEAGLFVVAHVLVRLIHMKLYIDAARAGRAGMRAIVGFAATTGLGVVLLLAGALAGGGVRDGLWIVALAIDYAGPAWLTRERLRGLQQVAVTHFADRYGDFVIICLGESILSVGVGVSATEHQLSLALVATASLGLMIALGTWWTYFDSGAGAARDRLRTHGDPVLAAADSYSYLHLLIIAGVIIYAGGIRMVVHNHLAPPMPAPGRLAFCGGVALYLLGVSAFRLRMLGQFSRGRVAVAVALLVLFAAGGGIPAWTTTAAWC